MLQATAVKKMISIIAGYTSKVSTAEEIEEFRKNTPGSVLDLDDDDDGEDGVGKFVS